jgi:DNA-binding NarL/FixJ family response regulator
VADDHPLTRDGIKAALALDAELEVEETQARVGEAIQAGAAGYLLKNIDGHELARAVALKHGIVE